ncbi:MAG: BamA/TamA family outer membrane protein [Chitinophagaceae bacterium]|nr:BamA/TamA family outer membrane protein [Chitinophagaceae bacterium]
MNRMSSAKLRVYLLIGVFLATTPGALSQYMLKILPADGDSILLGRHLSLSASFKSRNACMEYVDQLPALLLAKGFPTASVDSTAYDSASAAAIVFLGTAYKIGRIRTDGVDRRILERVGWNEKNFTDKTLNLDRLESLRVKMLDYLEENGYPFAKVQLDSLSFQEDRFNAVLKLYKGPLYSIDSIRAYGDAAISTNFLQHYLDITNGSTYTRSKLQNITKKLRELPYVTEIRPWDLTMLGTGSVINLYLKAKKSSQINALIGFLPASDQVSSGKLLLTGEANINLRNALGNGELIGVNWQQLQVSSPRLDLAFEQPYLFGTPFGITSSFNLFKKDSSFLNLSLLLGIQYAISANETGKVFIQSLTTNLLSIDTNLIKSTRALPDIRDVSSVNLGIDYEFNKTDYRFNPRKGSELRITTSAGTRKVRKNSAIVKMQAPDFSFDDLYDSIKLNSYQFRVRVAGAYYFPLTRQSTLKAGANGGWFQSPQTFRNELFQIGGYKLLRGFDEESIYASQYAVGTVEYRYLIGLNSFLSAFVDGGLTRNKSLDLNVKNSFIGGGLGLAFETKGGIFNLSYAVGKRDDVKFSLRQSKIHLGYVNYF